jgi:hypothetical protein
LSFGVSSIAGPIGLVTTSAIPPARLYAATSTARPTVAFPDPIFDVFGQAGGSDTWRARPVSILVPAGNARVTVFAWTRTAAVCAAEKVKPLAVFGWTVVKLWEYVWPPAAIATDVPTTETSATTPAMRM